MALFDAFRTVRRNVSDPPRSGFAITPSDSADLTGVTSSIFVGTGGNVAATPADNSDGTSITYKNLASGSILIGQFKRVWATGTTAADLVAYT